MFFETIGEFFDKIVALFEALVDQIMGLFGFVSESVETEDSTDDE